MKLADKRAAAIYGSVSIDAINELRKSNNAKKVFNALYFDVNDRGYSDFADSILKNVAKFSTVFAGDIAKKYSDAGNKFSMSEKQTWCVAFAFIKIENEITEII